MFHELDNLSNYYVSSEITYLTPPVLACPKIDVRAAGRSIRDI